MKKISISQEAIAKHFDELSKIGNLGPSLTEGFSRPSWSNEETKAMEYIKSVAEIEGFTGRYDAVGNLFIRKAGKSNSVVQVGSHLDTVPRGGLFDGGAGIIAGLEAVISINRLNEGLTHGLELVIWRGEESATFQAVTKGSNAAFGLNNPEILTRRYEGKTLGEAIESQGFSVQPILDSSPTMSQERVDDILMHLELHIEQARKLEIEKLDIGIVTGIRGTLRRRICIAGQAAHSGGTPMGIEFRKDANLAMAYMQVELDKLANGALVKNHDLVQTVGIINCDNDFNEQDKRVFENALTKVSPFAYFTLDVRSSSSEFLRKYVAESEELVTSIASKFDVEVAIEQVTKLEPLEKMDERIQESAENACVNLGYSYSKMASGALHDVAVVAKQKRSNGSTIPSGLLFIPCRDGLSHNPLEYSSTEAVTKGANVLAQMLYEAAI